MATPAAQARPAARRAAAPARPTAHKPVATVKVPPPPNLPGVDPEGWKRAAATVPAGITQREWHELMLVMAEVGAGRRVAPARIKVAIAIAEKSGATGAVARLKQVELQELMAAATPSGQREMASQGPVAAIKPAPKPDAPAPAPKAPAAVPSAVAAAAGIKKPAPASTAPKRDPKIPSGVTEAEWRAYWATFENLKKARHGVTLAELESARKVAVAANHKKSLATLDRWIGLRQTGADPSELKVYADVVTALRSGSVPSQGKIAEAARTATRLQGRSDLLGHVPAGIPGSEWASYLNILGALEETTPVTVVETARGIAVRAGHAKVAKGLARMIEARTKKAAPASSAASQPVAKQKDPKRPLQPAGKWNVSDKEYANYAAVQNALGDLDTKIAGSRLALALATARKYGHTQTAELIEDRMKAAGAPVPPAAKEVVAKAAPTAAPKFKVAVGPAVIEKPAVAAAAVAVPAAALAAIAPALRKHAAKPPRGIAPADWHRALAIVSAARKGPDNVNVQDLAFADDVMRRAGWGKTRTVIAEVAKARVKQREMLAKKQAVPADNVPTIKVTGPKRELPPGTTEAEMKLLGNVVQAIRRGDKVLVSDMERARAIAIKIGYAQTADNLANAIAARKEAIAKETSAKSSKTAVAAISKEEREFYDGVIRRIRSGEDVPADLLQRASLIAAKLGQKKTAKELHQQYLAGMRKKKRTATMIAKVPVTPKGSEIKKGAAKYGVPPTAAAKLIAEAKKGNPKAQEVIAKGEATRSAIEDGTIPTEQIAALRQEAATNPAAQQQLTALAAAEAVSSAAERAPAPPPPPALVANVPVAPTSSEISSAAAGMAVPPAAAARVLDQAKADPEAAAAIGRGAALMQEASAGNPQAQAQLSEIRKGAEAGIPEAVAAGAAIAAAGAATVAATKRPPEPPAPEPEAPAEPPVTAMKAQIAPGEGSGKAGLVIMGLGMAGLGIMALSKKKTAKPKLK